MTHVVQNLEKARVAYDEQSGSFWINAPKQPGFPEGYHERVTDVHTQLELMNEAIHKGLSDGVDLDAEVKFANDPSRVPLGMNLINGLPVYVNCSVGHYSPLTIFTGASGTGKTTLLMNFMIHGFKHHQRTLYWSDHPGEVHGIPPTVLQCETVTETLERAISIHESYPDSGLVWVVLDGDGMQDDEIDQIVKAGRMWRSLYPRLKIVWATHSQVNSQGSRYLFDNAYQVVMNRVLRGDEKAMLGLSDPVYRMLESVPFSGLAGGKTPFVSREVPLSARDIFSLWDKHN